MKRGRNSNQRDGTRTRNDPIPTRLTADCRLGFCPPQHFLFGIEILQKQRIAAGLLLLVREKNFKLYRSARFSRCHHVHVKLTRLVSDVSRLKEDFSCSST